VRTVSGPHALVFLEANEPRQSLVDPGVNLGYSHMTVSGRLFSKPTFDDIIVRRPICLWPPEPAYRAMLVSSSAHSEEET